MKKSKTLNKNEILLFMSHHLTISEYMILGGEFRRGSSNFLFSVSELSMTGNWIVLAIGSLAKS